MKKLENKVVVVTGAAMGNGFGIAKVMGKYGAKLVLTDIAPLDDAVNELKKLGYEAMGIHMDVSNSYEVKNGIEKVIEKYGRIDTLVNNAGIIRLGSLLETSDEIRDFHFNVNINGVWNVTKAVMPYMQKERYGRIVNLSSVTGFMVVDKGECAYATTKAAIMGFTRAVAREAAEYNITCNAILPGYILTPMAEQIANESNPSNPDSVIDGIASAVPLGRLGTIEEVGEVAAFLGSDESSYITGTPIVIDGGSTLPETVSVGV
ncbi:SDR family oxidoreductase UcpA [Streptobacillus felis]|uniref:SDR family oxidoreductase UcpA n=1 Tax=Streptobacillus felis TaxID=1384509 RepID=A0A7Z0TAF8_9FUSO|nr:SDR family oxidoreductase UcpA [Streptobacillus felis]NYV27965.1 SDR family oxidoreductase UcpA [Streptobacillus felis]